jgi:superfamily II DNA/RNA helicase
MNPKEITVAPPASPAATVTQGLAIVDEMDKREALRRLIRAEDVKNAVIFCNRKKDVDILWKSLTKHGFDAAALHGDMPQSKRTETLERFKANEIRLLVASDVAARGLDIAHLSHVFNFDVPIHPEDYVHRIGRTGRAGREGRAFTLATAEDGKFVEAIVKLIGKDIPRITIDGIAEVEFDPEAGRGRRRRSARSEARPSAREKSSSRGRERSRDRHREKPAEDAPTEQEQQVAATPAPEREPREERRGRSPRDEARRAPRGEARADAKGGRRDREEPDEPIVAFGDHTPNFLLRPVRLPSSPSSDRKPALAKAG